MNDTYSPRLAVLEMMQGVAGKKQDAMIELLDALKVSAVETKAAVARIEEKLIDGMQDAVQLAARVVHLEKKDVEQEARKHLWFGIAAAIGAFMGEAVQFAIHSLRH